MYSVVIADDEQQLRQAMVEGVRWEECGFEIIGQAENGLEALELVEQLEPDLVVTDIKMPLMSGLELARNIRESCPATQIVILSGYDDFEYAQLAIQYNIVRYLLKPLSASEMEAELHTIRQALDRRFSEMRGFQSEDLETVTKRLKITEFLLPLLMGSSEKSPEETSLNRRAAEIGLLAPDTTPRFGIVVSKFKGTDGKYCTDVSHVQFVNAIFGQYGRVESFLLNGRIATLFFLEDGDYMEQLRLPLKELMQSAQRMFTQQCTIGVSRECTGFSKCGSAYFEAVTARRYTADGSGAIRFIADQERGSKFEFDYVEKTVFRLEHLLKVGEKQKLSEFFEDLYNSEESSKNLDYLVIQILATVYRTVSAVSDKQAVAELVAANPIYSKAAFYDSHENIKSDLGKLCEDAREILSRNRKQDSEILCDRVEEIIDQEFSKESLSLTEVSARLSVSPNYLSTLIKKVKQKNFVTLLTERRMKEAYDLLTLSALKILEISEKCGYSDQHYFSYCFKKYYGLSPNKMRESGRS